ncbi:MAG: Cro/Cl family transcriptional regulator [SAR86 cluster bacterium]|uniref:Cro/Cl family transcriptional regulator n=1 Tax=SAR86 cluster bacterium TaxID=2030880 RepID=A0A2A5B4B1_9GAMM|nr:MAG: Cro/Cl family transcriptional regulator [SAR86 cluster bacterium]
MINKVDIAKACFVFVRDEIKHTSDYKLNRITCKASEVLEHGTGFCFAKSHLLAALLRANSIPAGLCYQRLVYADDAPLVFCLHGLNSVFLEDHGWYRMDARGNKDGVNAQFSPPLEQLAFPIVNEGEADLPEMYSEPLAAVIDVLSSGEGYRDVVENLPDILP